MSRRATWEFEFTITELSGAARAKAVHHRDRQTFWQTEASAREQEIRETAGIELMPITGGNRAELRADPAILRRHDEAQNKVQAHKRLAEEYEMYAAAFELAKHGAVTGLLLHADDILFFGLAGASTT